MYEVDTRSTAERWGDLEMQPRSAAEQGREEAGQGNRGEGEEEQGRKSRDLWGRVREGV